MSSEKEYDLAGQVIGCAMAVHRALGAGFLESVYQNALAIEMVEQGIDFDNESELCVTYKKKPVGHFRADFFVEGSLIVEIKAVQSLTKAHEVQLVNYLNATNIAEGLLLNFGEQSLKFNKKFKNFQSPSLQK